MQPRPRGPLVPWKRTGAKRGNETRNGDEIVWTGLIAVHGIGGIRSLLFGRRGEGRSVGKR